jgi:hypothetical protein
MAMLGTRHLGENVMKFSATTYANEGVTSIVAKVSLTTQLEHDDKKCKLREGFSAK